MPPSRDQPEHRTDDTAARQISAPEFVAELGALISELEAAEGGSQSLDIRIHNGIRILGGLGEDMASLLIKEGISWPTVQATLKEIVPPYSTSLDAALQGEEIVFAIRSAKGFRWGAMQRTASGGEELAWAATEPLARRLAALKSWHADLKKSLEDDENLSNRSMDGRPEPPQPVKSGVDESAVTDKREETTGGSSNKEVPDTDVTRLYDNPERPQNDISEQARNDISDNGQNENPDHSDQEEKDWEILF